MDVILNLVQHSKRRLKTQACLHRVCHWMCLACIGILLIVIADRFLPIPLIGWYLATCVILGALALTSIIAWCTVHVGTIYAATEVDRRFDLKDRITTSLTVEGTPFGEVVVQDAVHSIRTSDLQKQLKHKFPIQSPQSSLWLCVLVISTFIVLNTGQWNIFSGAHGGVTPDSPNSSQVEESIQQIVAQIEESQYVSDQLEEELNDLQLLNGAELDSPEVFQHEALRKITDLQKRLSEMLNSEELLAFDGVQQRLQELELPRDEATLPLVTALKKGDFNKAQEEFQKLENQLQSDSLSDEEKESIKDALNDLSNQLDELSQMNEELASALSSAGLDESLADNLEAAKKAVEQSKTLNDEQKQQLLDMIKKQEATEQMCKQLSSNCKQCANGSESSANNTLEQLNALQMFKTEAELAKSQCQNAGAGMCAKPSGSKEGTGGTGQGNGGMNNVEETDFSTVAERSPVNSEKGKIIASHLFNGGLLTSSESSAELREAVLTERVEAEQAITEEQIPRKYHDLLRHYFGQLEKMTETEGAN